MSTVNASDARLQSPLDQMAISHEPVHIAGKRNARVLAGDPRGAYSRRINIQHRLVYQVAARCPVAGLVVGAYGS